MSDELSDFAGDEIALGAGFKRNTRGYDNVTINVWYKSSVRDSETPQQAYDRVKDFVEAQLKTEASEIEQARRNG